MKRVEQTVAYAAGMLLIVSGFAHTLVWWIAGGSWAGDVSWRKPILFGISAGVTLLSMGWLTGKVTRRLGDSVYLSLFAIAMVAEVGLITMQTWRGVASHFNDSTPFDAQILFWIEALILFATIVIADLTIRTVRTLDAPSDMRLAIRAGMAFLLVGCLLGFVAVGIGNYQKQRGRPPGIYGQAGVTKFPHGMPLHAIQYFPMLVWGLHQIGMAEPQRLRALQYATLSMAAFTAFSLWQTFSGKARFDVDGVAVALLGISTLFAAFLIGSAIRTLVIHRVGAYGEP